MTSEVINFAEKLARFSDHWPPRVVGEMNDYQFKLVKLEGEFVWHDHKDTDEAFILMKGEMEIGFRDRSVALKAGEMFVVPRRRAHHTRARRVPCVDPRTTRGGKYRRHRGCMQRIEELLLNLGCPKINLLIRAENREVADFYRRIGYTQDPVLTLGKRLINDQARSG